MTKTLLEQLSGGDLQAFSDGPHAREMEELAAEHPEMAELIQAVNEIGRAAVQIGRGLAHVDKAPDQEEGKKAGKIIDPSRLAGLEPGHAMTGRGIQREQEANLGLSL
jgi:hypothetical protein